jgi:hypothetical protein
MTKKEQLIGWLKARVEVDSMTEEYIGFIMDEYKEETEKPDVSWMWHCSEREQNVLDYRALTDDENIIPALNIAAQFGYRTCLRHMENLEIIEMGDIDRSLNSDDQHQFDKAFGDE